MAQPKSKIELTAGQSPRRTSGGEAVAVVMTLSE